jgi:O-antigen ligase
MIKKIITKLTYILIVIYPIGLLLRFKFISNAYVVPQDIIVALISLLTFIYIIKKKHASISVFVKLQIIFIVFGVLSLVVNYILHPDIKFLQSILYPLRYLLYVTLLFAPIEKSSKEGLKKSLYISGFVILLMGYWQFFFYYDLYKLFYLGWDNHLYRMFSTFLDPNYAGVFFVLYFFLLFEKIKSNTFVNIYKDIIISFLCLIAVYLTFSRTALFALVAGAICYAIFYRKLKALVLVLFIMSIFLLIISDTHVEGLNPFRTASTNSRVNSIKESLSIFKTSPLIGVGFNSYRYAQVRMGYRNERGASWSNADAGTDNSFLFILAITGIMGFFIYLLSLLNFAKGLLTYGRTNFMLFASFCSLLIASLFINVLFYTPILTIWFLMINLFQVKKVKVDK